MARDKILQIQRIQNMSIRGIVGIPRYIPVSIIHEELKIGRSSPTYIITFIQPLEVTTTPQSAAKIISNTPPTAFLCKSPFITWQSAECENPISRTTTCFSS
ncbi:hypothetical protein TNCV_3211781 [Trichonephila clavipes]|uniref:Uncharacterized protein n=1 Tax=Trichonephila clavipes TaxID=2585209 RepID=A0A8X6S0I8_TRICX|nr:hypothetical protein TNCV_3211781 [Trichonephila clavipes]